MLWPRTAACACLLFLAGSAAAQTPSRTHDCYRGRPLPPCRSFWITEFGLLGRLNALPEPRTTVDPFFRWEVGGMQNRNERTAFGATIVIEADDLGSRYGITPRYRRWLAPSLALDLSAGVLVAGSDDFRFPGFVGQVAVLGGDYVGAALQVETFRHFGRRDVGVYGGLKFGSVPGVIASFVLPLLIIASRIPET